jgi:putative ABC transport system permease protein
MVQALPLRDDYFLSIAIEGRPEPPPGEEPSVNYRVVSPGYFETMGIPLERGRAIDERDRADAPFVAVVDDELVKRHFPAEDPIGRRIDVGNGLDDVYEIVGVVGDVRHDSLDLSPHPTIYVPFRQDAFSTMSLLVRADVDPRLLAPDAREAVRELDRNLPPYSEGALESVLADSLAERRFSMLLLVLFAGIASFLAAVGLYGVVSYAVSRRTREVGLRVAMGAPPTSLIREILGEGMKPALAGVVLGLVSALALSRALESFLYGVTAFDPASYAATALGLLVVAVIACLVPAWKASRMDPLEALRHE